MPLVLFGTFSARDVANADRAVVRDPADSSSRIDISEVLQGHYFEYALYRVTAYEQWDPIDLADGGLVFDFDTDDDPAIERRAILEYTGGGGAQMRLSIYDGDGNRIGRGVLRRPSQRSVEIWIKRWQLGSVKTYETFVTVTTTDQADCSAGCTDRAPDAGTIFHRLRPLCADREPTITGTRGSDTLKGTGRSDVIDARGGDDEIRRVNGNDIVCAGAGDDLVRGGEGFLFLRGGRGADRITATGPPPSRCDDTAACAYPEAILIGGSGGDLLTGGSRHERLVGGRGHDVLRGREWADGLDGGRGRDTLWGGPGEDGCVRGEELHSC
ncbi:MAG: hypothetical protein M3N53_04915 [Actinomycetota bacterium]|nr:hypothetical protein [Actinomycetota bacterium]